MLHALFYNSFILCEIRMRCDWCCLLDARRFSLRVFTTLHLYKCEDVLFKDCAVRHHHHHHEGGSLRRSLAHPENFAECQSISTPLPKVSSMCFCIVQPATANSMTVLSLSCSWWCLWACFLQCSGLSLVMWLGGKDLVDCHCGDVWGLETVSL